MENKKLSENHKKNISKSMIGNSNGSGNKGRIGIMRGRKHNLKSKEKMSITRINLIKEGKIKIWCKGKSSKEDFRIIHGNKVWSWKGGITPINKLLRNSSKYKVWREKVFLRDNFTCQKCNKLGGNLEAHHKKSFALFPKLRFVVSNGITLCKRCHIKEDKYRGEKSNGK
jgi:hypothetical protein